MKKTVIWLSVWLQMWVRMDILYFICCKQWRYANYASATAPLYPRQTKLIQHLDQCYTIMLTFMSIYFTMDSVLLHNFLYKFLLTLKACRSSHKGLCWFLAYLTVIYCTFLLLLFFLIITDELANTYASKLYHSAFVLKQFSIQCSLMQVQ